MSLRGMFLTLAAIAIGLFGLVAAVGAASPYLVLASSGGVGLAIALSGIFQRRQCISKGAPVSRVESITAAHMGLIWLWGALAIVTVYPFLMSWREWPHFFGAFLAAGLISLGYAQMLARDAAKGRDDAAILQLGRYLAWAQFAGMLVTLAGLVIDPDKELLYIKETDWAGNGIFFTGAASLLLITAEALFLTRMTLPEPGGPINRT